LNKNYIKSGLILILLLIISLILPSAPLDPWNILSPKKIAAMIFTLAFLQAMGAFVIQLLGPRKGALITGFTGGLISSTAMTAALAKKTKLNPDHPFTPELLTYLAATLAMLFEAMAIITLYTKDMHFSLLVLFVGPVVTTGVMILLSANNKTQSEIPVVKSQLEILPIVKLALFIIGILGISKVLVRSLGNSGLYLLTFFVSLFEIHGSFIANVQMHDNAIFGVRVLGSLLTLSMAASYLSKVFLIYTLGSAPLTKYALRFTLFVLLSLAASWVVFILITEVPR
jgi:uncharacterized membrane protein (DUF4010 family)